MKEFVAGFLFSSDKKRVAMIEKIKPEWQRGHLNGIGGKVEIGEQADIAMRREFREETSVDIENWTHYVTLAGDDFRVFFYYHVCDPNTELIDKLQSITEETVKVFAVHELPTLKTIPNVQWLIPMALSLPYDSADCFVVREFYNQ